METSKWIHWAWQVQVQVHVVSLGWRIFSLLLKLMVNDCCCCRRRRECCLPSRYVWKRVKARKAQIMVVLSATTSTATAAHKVDQFYALLCLIIWAISETTATANCCSRSLSLLLPAAAAAAATANSKPTSHSLQAPQPSQLAYFISLLVF